MLHLEFVIQLEDGHRGVKKKCGGGGRGEGVSGLFIVSVGQIVLYFNLIRLAGIVQICCRMGFVQNIG